MLTCYHLPSLPCRLLCPQQLGNTPDSKTNQLPNGAWIGGGRTAKVCYQGNFSEFPYDPDTNLPCNKTAIGISKFCAFISSHSKDNNNLLNT